MSDDALYLMDLFNQIVAGSQEKMYNKSIRNNSFDRLSYGTWAIQETITSMHEYEYYLSVGVIREILVEQQNNYERYYNTNKERNIRYKYALDTVNHLLSIVGGYRND